MKKFYFKNLLAVTAITTLMWGNVCGQSTANYAFTTNTTGSLALDRNGNIVDMTTGTTTLNAADLDDNASTAVAIGFPLFFYGNAFTQFSTSSNGLIQLGSTVPGTTTYVLSGGSTTTPRLGAFTADLRTGIGGKVHYKLVGTAPNRCLVIEFNNMSLTYVATPGSNDGTYQVRLYETTGVVEYVYGSMFRNSSTTTSAAIHIGFSVGTTANTTASVTSSTHTVSNGATFNLNSYTTNQNITDLHSTSNGSRRRYTFTPPVPTTGPSSLTFSAITTTGMTLNWTAASPTTNILKYAIYNSLNGGTTWNYVAVTASAATINYAATGLQPGTTYHWKVVPISEGAEGSTIATGNQATTAGATYYWVGVAAGADFNTAANWNTNPAGGGTTRTTPSNTDVLIMDGAGTTAGVAGVITLSAAGTGGQFIVNNNTTCTLQSSTTTTRTITLSGGPGNDFVVEQGSTLTMNHATQAAAFAFSGTGLTGDISGTLTFGGSTSNVVTTTGGTGTLVTVAGTGIVNMGSTGISLVGSTSTLSFANGSNCNVTGNTTGAYPIPLASWGASSNLTLSGATTTSTTTATNNIQTFGNFTVNLPAVTGTLSFWTSSTTAVIQGNLTITTLGTGGIFRALTSGTLTVNGNLIVNGGSFQVASSTGTLNVLGNVNIGGGTFDIAQGGASSLRVAGNFVQTAGTLTQTSSSGILEFNGSSAQTFTPGTQSGTVTSVRVNNAAGLNLTSALSLNRLQISNGNMTGTGTITYNGTTPTLTYNSTTGSQAMTSVEFPLTSGPASLTINNTSSNKLVTMGFSRTLTGTTGVLALTSGVLDNSGFTITIPNTATAAITGASASNFIKGSVERDLPASLVSGSTYTFPIGKSLYKPFELVNPTTNAGGTVRIRAEVFDANAGGTAGLVMSALNSNRYWAASISSGSANFTNSLIRLNDTPNGADAIAASVTLTGAYDMQGGTAITSTASSLTTTAPAVTSIPGFYVMGNKAAATLASLAISPTGNQCTHVSRSISVSVTSGGGAVDSVVLIYAVNGGTSVRTTMSSTLTYPFTGTSTCTSTIPTISPTNGTVTWSVIAYDANNLTKSQSGTSYTDEPNTGFTATASATATSACAGSPDTLSVVLSKLGAVTLGAGATTGSSYDALFYHLFGGNKAQFLIPASELIALGLKSGNITSLGFNMAGVGITYNGFAISIDTTTRTNMSAGLSNSGTFLNVVPSANYTPVSGANNFTLTTPFNWNGTSSLIVQLCWSNNNGGGTSCYAKVDATAYVSCAYYRADNLSSSAICSGTTATGTTSNRPQFYFTGNTAPTPTAHNWIQNNTTVVSTSHPYTFSVAAGSNGYKDSVIINNCPVVSNTVTINNSVPAFAFTTVSSSKGASFCVSDAPTTLSTNASGGCTPYTYNWSGPSGASGTSATLSASATGTYNVTVTDNAGTSITQSIAITVNNPTPSVTPQTKCSGATTFTLGATVAAAGDSLFWYTDSLGNTQVGSGSSFTTPTISTTTKYFVGEVALSNTASGLGRASTAATAGTTPANYGLVFTLTKKASLNSVNVYLRNTSASSVTVVLQNSAGTQLQSKTISVPVGSTTTPVLYTLPLNFVIDAGTGYRLLASTGADMVRESALGGFPYSLGSFGSITDGYFSGTSNTYYYFYGWNLSDVCVGTRVPVMATLNTPPALAIDSPNFSVCKGATSAAVSATAATVGNFTTYSWSPTTGVTSPNSSSTTFTPSTTTSYTLSGTDGTCSRTVSITITAADTPSRLTLSQGMSKTNCSERIDSIVASGGIAIESDTLGTGTSTNTADALSATDYPAPYGAYYENARQQYLIRASELTALGLASGSELKAITFDVTTLGTSGVHKAYTISIGNTAQSAISTWESGLTTVYGPIDYQPISGNNLHTFSTPFVWNGTSNIIVQVCHTNDATNSGTNYTVNAISKFSTTAFNSSLTYRVDDASACASSSITYTEAQRPNMIFTVSNQKNITWSPTTGIFTNSAATTPYSSGHAAKLYTKNTSTIKYYAQSQLGNCIVRDSIIDSANTAANMVTLASTSAASAVAQCTDGGWTYYGTAANPDKLIFAIQKGSSGLTGESVSITIDGTNFSNFSSNGANQEHKSIFMKRSWDVTATPGFTPPVNVRFFYDATDSSDVVAARDADSVTLKGSNPNSLLRNTPFTWFKSKNTAYTTWRSINVRGNQFTAGTYDILTPLGYGTQNGIRYVEFAVTSFSGGTGGAGFGPSGGGGGGVGLPVTWAGFDVETTELGNELTWKTASEQNTSHFEVEYSYNAMQWSAMSDQIPAAGNSADLRTYNYTHSDFEPFVYYRIKQVDLDGQFDYSVIKLAKRSEGPSFVVKVYPIPLENDNMVNVSVKGIDKSPMNISMTDMTGKVIRNINFTPSSESIKESFDMSPLAPGIYFIEVQNGQGKEVFKVSR